MTKIEAYAAQFNITPDNIKVHDPASSTKFRVGALIVGLIGGGLFIAGAALICTGSLTTGSILMIVGGCVLFIDIGVVAKANRFHRQMIEDITNQLDTHPDLIRNKLAVVVDSRDKKYVFYATREGNVLNITYIYVREIDKFNYQVPLASMPSKRHFKDPLEY